MARERRRKGVRKREGESGAKETESGDRERVGQEKVGQ